MKTFINKNLKYFCVTLVITGSLLVSCADLDVPSPTIVSDADVFANRNTMMLYLTRLYSQMPFEDFKYSPARQFFYDWLCIPDANSGQLIHFEDARFMTSEGDLGNGPYWTRAFASLRDANYLLEEFSKYQENFDEDFYRHCIGEAYFTRAMVFYALAKRYGGIPLVTQVLNYPEVPAAELETRRSSEEETWDQVLSDFDQSIAYLNETSPVRGLANKNVALGFKSEAMLFAGSVAKYNKLTGFGQKTGVRVIGFDPDKEEALSKKYFMESYKAAREIMRKNRYALYKKGWSPANRQAQYQNMVDMFFDAASEENIYIREYVDSRDCHGYDAYAVPFQQWNGTGYSSRACPTLDFVELYDGLPKNPDGTIKVFDREKDDPDRKYLLFDSPLDFFKDAEPRLRAYVVFPMDELRGEAIDVRRGIFTGDVTGGIAPLMCFNGAVNYEISSNYYYNMVDAYQGRGAFTQQELYVCEQALSGKTWLTVKWANGRDTTLTASGINGPFSGLLGSLGGLTIRKWLDPKTPITAVREEHMTQHFILMRYAEILLNAAEAACELAIAGENAPAGDNFQEIATNAIRDIRERAGADPLAGTLTLDEDGKMLIRKERKKELAYENKNLWDIRRWRTQHSDVVNGRTADNGGVVFRGLYPFYAEKAGKYFIDVRHIEQGWAYVFAERNYYFAIPAGEVSKSPVIDQQPYL